MEVAVQEYAVGADRSCRGVELITNVSTGTLNHVGRTRNLTVGSTGRGRGVRAAVLAGAGLRTAGGENLRRHPATQQQCGHVDRSQHRAERLEWLPP
jgi:hypothetical protein